MIPVPQDTPVHRATISELTVEQLDALVASMRERRMRAQKAYELAQEAKARIKEEKGKARYEHVLKMFDKKLESTEKSLEAMGKYILELKALELVLGE